MKKVIKKVGKFQTKNWIIKRKQLLKIGKSDKNVNWTVEFVKILKTCTFVWIACLNL